MRQVWITKTGAPDVLKVREAADPEVQAGQVRIRVKAAGINFADLLARQGLYPDAPKVPCVVGYEVSGVVDAVGAGVTTVAVGDRAFGMPRFGGYSDVVVLPAAQAFRMPAAMSFEEAAALPVVYITAHHMMHFVHKLRPGSRVLIHSAAGGVGLAALQLARAARCVVFGTASPGKHAFLVEEGCQHPLDSALSGAALEKAVRAKLAESGAGGLDLVLDPVGGTSLRTSYSLLDAGGHVVAFGMSAMSSGNTRNLFAALGAVLRTPRFHPISLMNDNKTVSGVNMGHLFERVDLLTPQFEALLAMYERGEIRPYVDRSFPFTEAAAAHQYLHDRKARGKILLVPRGAPRRPSGR